MKTKLIAIITAALISSNASSAVNIFTPTGGAFSGTQSETLYWDMTSNLASKSYNASYVGQFNLSDHGDFHHDFGAGSGMVISSESVPGDYSVGVRLNIGDVVGPSRTFSTIGFTGTTDFGGTMTSSPGCTTASMMVIKACVAPAVIVISVWAS